MYLVTKLLFYDQFNEKRLAIYLPLIMELWCIQILVNRNCWWCWTVLSTIVKLQCDRLYILLMILMVLNCIYLVMEATIIAYLLRQDLQWCWTLYGFTHILCVSFADGFIGLLLCILYVFCTWIFVLYLVLTESWYE